MITKSEASEDQLRYLVAEIYKYLDYNSEPRSLELIFYALYQLVETMRTENPNA